jgi:nucleotide-binding universal stress UspA family protein
MRVGTGPHATGGRPRRWAKRCASRPAAQTERGREPRAGARRPSGQSVARNARHLLKVEVLEKTHASRTIRNLADQWSIVRVVLAAPSPWARTAGKADGTLHFGRPADVLIGLSEAVDILVIGSRGYGPLKAVLLGGVSDQVIRSAACPVVVVPRGAASARLSRRGGLDAPALTLSRAATPPRACPARGPPRRP